MDNGSLYNRLLLQHFDGRLLDLKRGWHDSKQPRSITELWLIVDGGGYLQIDGREYHLKPGDFCFLPDTLAASYGCDQDRLLMHIVGLESNLLSGSLFDWLHCSDWVVHLSAESFEECQRLMQAVAVLWSEKRELPPLRHLQLNRDLHALLVFFLSKVTVQEKRQDDWLGKILQYIDRHTNEDLTVTALARRVALHPNYFIQRFHMQVGVSPAKYVAGVRLKQAQMLLVNRVPLSDIPAQVGFADMQCFARFFKRHTGMTPQQYQHKQQEGV